MLASRTIPGTHAESKASLKISRQWFFAVWVSNLGKLYKVFGFGLNKSSVP